MKFLFARTQSRQTERSLEPDSLLLSQWRQNLCKHPSIYRVPQGQTVKLAEVGTRLKIELKSGSFCDAITQGHQLNSLVCP